MLKEEKEMSNVKTGMTQFHPALLYYCMAGISLLCWHELDSQLQTSFYIIHKKPSHIGIALAMLAKAELFSLHQKGLRFLERLKLNEH